MAGAISTTPFDVICDGERGTRYNTHAWGYHNSLSMWRKTVLVCKGGYVSIQDYDVDMDQPPPPVNEEGIENLYFIVARLLCLERST